MAITITISPAEVNLKGIIAGDVNTFDFYLHKGPTPFDLTGVTISAQARKKPSDAASIEATVEMDPDPASGKFLLRWDGGDVRDAMGATDTWSGVWDAQLEQGPDVTTFAYGTFDARMDVTR